MPWVHRLIAPSFWLFVAIGLAGSTAAQSAPILIDFEGVVSAAVGTPPGGAVSNGTPFTGSLAYDSSAPNSDPGAPILGLYLFDSPPFRPPGIRGWLFLRNGSWRCRYDDRDRLRAMHRPA